MSAIGILIDDTSAKTKTSPEAVRGALDLAVSKIPRDAKIDAKNLVLALAAARRDVRGTELVGDREEICLILDHLENELNSLGRLKQVLVFGAIRSGIDELRSELPER